MKLLPLAQQQVLAAFVLGAAVLVGWGSLFRQLCGYRTRRIDDCFAALFEGWAVLLGVLQIWHLFLPVDTRAGVFAIGVGVAGLTLVDWRLWLRLAHRLPYNLPALLLGVVAALWLSQLALEGPRHGDAGGYYLPTILWMARYPIVVGLGNLYAPYAYNQSYFLYAAAASLGPFAQRSYHILNSLLIMGLLGRGALGLWRVLWPTRRVGWNDLYYLLLIPGLLALSASIFFTTPSPDVGVFVVGAALFGSLIELASRRGCDARFHLLALVLFALAGWTVKLAFAGMTAALLIVAPLGWYWRERPALREFLRPASAATLIAVLLFVPWVVGNLLMSGCPFFPSAAGALDVPWRVNLDVQKWIQDTMQVGPVRLFWEQPWWVWQRLQSFGWMAPDVALPLAVGGAALCLTPLLAGLRWLTGRPSRSRLPFWIAVPPLVSLVFAWLLTPVPRYAGATMWLVGISLTLLCCGGWLRETRLGRLVSVVGAVAMSVWLLVGGPYPWPGYKEFIQAPTVVFDARELASGLTVNVPRNIESCFSTPLPCAPHPEPNLKLRRPGELSGGFEVAR